MRSKSGTIRSQDFENRRGEGPGDEVVTGTDSEARVRSPEFTKKKGFGS